MRAKVWPVISSVHSTCGEGLMRVCMHILPAQKELSTLEEEANLPIEEVIRRMKEKAGNGEDAEEEEEDFAEDDEDDDEDEGEDEDEDDDDDDDEAEEEDGAEEDGEDEGEAGDDDDGEGEEEVSHAYQLAVSLCSTHTMRSHRLGSSLSVGVSCSDGAIAWLRLCREAKRRSGNCEKSGCKNCARGGERPILFVVLELFPYDRPTSSHDASCVSPAAESSIGA
eukprot:6185810-Pleurochrysis_carterae.AAC.4